MRMIGTLLSLWSVGLSGCADCWSSMCWRAKRTEALVESVRLRDAVLAYERAFDAVDPCGDRDVSRAGKAARRWVDEPNTYCFDMLGWAPSTGLVRGVYWVDVPAGGGDFTVHAVIDIDADGERAHAVVGRSGDATWVSPDDVY